MAGGQHASVAAPKIGVAAVGRRSDWKLFAPNGQFAYTQKLHLVDDALADYLRRSRGVHGEGRT